MFVTARTDEWRELLRELVEALNTNGLEAVIREEALVVDNISLVPQLIERSHPTPADLRDLVEAGRGSSAPVVVADRISAAGRDVLREYGWGWLDRRGHLRLWSPGVRIETPIAGSEKSQKARPTNPWTGVGLEVALASLVDPESPVTARRLAPVIGRSVSATHDSIGRFAEVGLVGQRTNLPLLPDLFWETSAHWPDDAWVGLPVTITELAETVEATDLVRVDERAATLGGARIAAAGELPPRLYIRTSAALRRARSLADRNQPNRCWVRSSPVNWLPLNEEHPPDADHPWGVAHPVVCALRLAKDPARGREVVEDWNLLPADDWDD